MSLLPASDSGAAVVGVGADISAGDEPLSFGAQTNDGATTTPPKFNRNGNGQSVVQPTPEISYEPSKQSKQSTQEKQEKEASVEIISEPLPEPGAPSEAEGLWNCLKEQIGSWHFKPDFQAVQIVLAFEASYQISLEDHLWLHLIGPSSSGKTSLGIAMLDGLFKDHHQLGEITPNTFLSGLTRGKQKGKMNSFLHQIGDRGLIYAPDFTNFLSNDSLTVGKIAGQLRQIYDGYTSKRAGSMDQVNEWSGNLAMVTAFTPSKEYSWLHHNREGERFLTLRWNGVEAVGEAEETKFGGLMKLGARVEKQTLLRDVVREMVLANGEGEYVDEEGRIRLRTGLTSPGTSNIQDRSFKLARLVGKLRTLPVRSDGKNISHVSGEEGPGRVFKQLIKAARGWAALMRRDEVLPEDWLLAERLAIDTIPETRRWMLESLPWGGGSAVTSKELLLEMTPFHTKEALDWHLQDLIALGVVEMNGLGEISLKEKFVLLAEAGCRGWVEDVRRGWGEKAELAGMRLAQREFGVVGK